MQSFGVGIIGAGHIAKSHAKVWLREDRLVAVCSRQRHKAEKIACDYGIPFVCATARQLINRNDIDIVCITTPHHLHYPLAMSAMAAGKHVFCEKPLALNVAEAQEMWEFSQQMGVKTGVQFAERTNWPSLMRLGELVHEGGLGDILYFEGSWAFDWAQSPTHPMSWRFRKATAGSGALGDLGAYMIDAARWLVGEITDVYADLVTLIGQRPVVSDLYDFSEIRRLQADGVLPPTSEFAEVENDDECALQISFASGARGAIRASRVQRYNTVRIDGSGGSCKWDLGTEELLYRRQGESDFKPVSIPGRLVAKTMVSQFVANIRDGTDLAPTFLDGLETQRVIDAAILSSGRRQWTSVH